MAIDMFLKISDGDGIIAGDSQDGKHRGEIVLRSFSWGESNNAGTPNSGGGGGGHVAMQDFHFQSDLIPGAPRLFLACASGRHFPSARLTCRKAGEDSPGIEFLKYTLTNTLVTTFENSGDGDGTPIRFSLTFQKIRIDVADPFDKREGDQWTSAEWDRQANMGK